MNMNITKTKVRRPNMRQRKMSKNNPYTYLFISL